MKYRRRGNGPAVSAMGLGCTGMSEFYGSRDDTASVATIHRTLELLIVNLENNLAGEQIMSLQDKLDEYKAQFESSLPPEALAIMHRATDDLRQSGIMERVLKIGDHAPEFALPNAQGQIVNSAKLLEKGPLVVSFYRGVW